MSDETKQFINDSEQFAHIAVSTLCIVGVIFNIYMALAMFDIVPAPAIAKDDCVCTQCQCKGCK